GDAAAHLGRFLSRPELQEQLEAPPPSPMRRLLPLQPIPRTYAGRLVVGGGAGGFTKPTTGGGVFYSLLTASLAAETLIEGFQAGRLDPQFLVRFEQRWRAALGPELRIGAWMRHLLSRASDEDLAMLVRAMAEGDLQTLLGHAGRFNWHRDLIVN